jgi:hypothetical protein
MRPENMAASIATTEAPLPAATGEGTQLLDISIDKNPRSMPKCTPAGEVSGWQNSWIGGMNALFLPGEGETTTLAAHLRVRQAKLTRRATVVARLKREGSLRARGGSATRGRPLRAAVAQQ